MNTLAKLKEATNREDFAKLLKIELKTLTYCLYRLKPDNQYKTFSIPKKRGGERIINAPYDRLKMIQKKLSLLLQDCEDEINGSYFSKDKNIDTPKQKSLCRIKNVRESHKEATLSHGFERYRSVLTNAHMHLGKRNILNIDLEDFFDSFNFGRVRGFFIKNRNFLLQPEIATIIAQIACYNNKLPQGSPCSPVITNLISHALDIRLAKLAHKNSCTYTRYADDITFSTRKAVFPPTIAKEENGLITISDQLCSEIRRSGFKINDKKTRLQYKDSRQDVTGIIVNKKINTKNEYWRLVRSQCHSLFKKGTFFEKCETENKKGNIRSLTGKLSFINMVDYYNRLRQSQDLKPPSNKKKGKEEFNLNCREKTYQIFLFYTMFYANPFPALLTEGKTDILHLKAAIKALASQFPLLAKKQDDKEQYNLLLQFIKYTKKTEFFLKLYEDEGCDGLSSFIVNYDSFFSYYRDALPENPVIIIVDNDSGPNNIAAYFKQNIKKSSDIITYPPNQEDIRKTEFIHIKKNLYLIFLPRGENDAETDIEYFYTATDRLREYKGKCFNTISQRNAKTDLSKNVFAEKIVWENRDKIDFSGFEKILNRIEAVIKDYRSYKSNL